MDHKTAEQIISRFASLRILVIGDFMLDEFVWGRVERISPEAPVPVVNVERETFSPGGAGNVVMNLRAMGASAIAIGVIGRDSTGAQIADLLQASGADIEGLHVDDRPTTRKTRIVAHQQQVVRVDREERNPVPSSVETALANTFLRNLASVNAVIVSDYSKGTMNASLLAKILPAARHRGVPVCVDPKPRNFSAYSPVTAITPNQAEAGNVVGYTLVTEEDVQEAGRKLLQLIRCDHLLITRGEKGMALISEDSMTLVPARAREVFDVTGAGDTVISVLALALAAGGDILSAVDLTNRAAGLVVGKLGTATVSSGELLSTI